MINLLIMMICSIVFFTVIGFIVSLFLPKNSESNTPQKNKKNSQVIDYNLAHTLEYYERTRNNFRISSRDQL